MSTTTPRASKGSITKKTDDSKYPPPFSKAPETLQSFLTQLDPAQIYIAHIDRHRPDYKKQIFLFAVLVNSTIAFLLTWRLYVAVPKYLALLQTLFGYASSASVDIASTTRKEQLGIVLRRTGMMALDFLFFRFIGPWPLSFFFERPANPVTWRWKVGFLPEEVVVRVSRNWAGDDLMKGPKKGEQSPFFKTRIAPATEAQFMKKTGYLMMDGSWDLDFELMQNVHMLVKHGDVKAEDLDRVVLAHQAGDGWLAWKFESDTSDIGAELRNALEAEERKKD